MSHFFEPMKNGSAVLKIWGSWKSVVWKKVLSQKVKVKYSDSLGLEFKKYTLLYSWRFQTRSDKSNVAKKSQVFKDFNRVLCLRNNNLMKKAIFSIWSLHASEHFHIPVKKTQRACFVDFFLRRQFKILIPTICSIWSLLLKQNLFWTESTCGMSKFLKRWRYLFLKNNTYSFHFIGKLLRDSMKTHLPWPTFKTCPIEPNTSCLSVVLA